MGRSIKKNSVGRPSRKPDQDVMKILLEKHNTSEIGRILGVPSSTVRSWVFRERKQMGDCKREFE